MDIDAERLFRTYHDTLVRYLTRRLGDRDWAEEVAQETFVRALRQRGAIPASAPLRALYDQCLIAFPADDEDRPLDEDIAVAERVIAELAASRDG